jgi:tryptophan synthase beta chain
VRFAGATDEEVIAAMRLTMGGRDSRPWSRPTPLPRPSRRRRTDVARRDHLINQSGRGDKDIFTIADAFDDPKWKQFIIEKAKQYHA